METDIILYGASGHCKVVIDCIRSNGEKAISIIDDNPKATNLFGIPVLLTKGIKDFGKSKYIISIGNNQIRKKIANKLLVAFDTAIHSKAIVSRYSEIMEGSTIMAGAIINPDTKIGRHCIINTGAVIEHDCLIGDFAHISPNASLAGNVTVGEGSHVGIGAAVIQGINIGKWVTIGAGAVVIRDVPDYAVVVGNPATLIRYNEVD